MAKAVRPLGDDDAPWIELEPFGFVDVAGREFNAAWLTGHSEEELAALGLRCADINDGEPLALPPGIDLVLTLADVEGVPTRVRSWGDASAADLRAAKIAHVKAEAERRILAVLPEVQQRNSLALGLEAVTLYGPDTAAWSEALQSTYLDVIAKWLRIKAIREASNEIEASIPLIASEVAAFDVTLGWPT